MKNKIGLDRVLEYKGAAPVSAWKLDNSKEIGPHELRINVEYVYLEKNDFRQICSECGYEDVRVKAKIFDIIAKRGKLDNPFTDTGGTFYGTVDEIGTEFSGAQGYAAGDEVFCTANLSGVPVKIDEILEIDYNYNILRVRGYAIVFEGTALLKRPEGMEIYDMLIAFEECGCIALTRYLARKGKTYLIEGQELALTILYSGVIRRTTDGDCRIIAVMDESDIGNISRREIEECLSDYVDRIYYVDLKRPIEMSEMIVEAEGAAVDFVINFDDLPGSGTLSAIVAKERGTLIFTGYNNKHSKSVLVAESLDKELIVYSLSQNLSVYQEATLQLIRDLKEPLGRVRKIYGAHKNIRTRLANDQRNARLIADSENICKIDDFVYSGQAMRSVAENVLNIAKYDCNVIIEGETGVGKEKVLNLIHKNSIRNTRPCVKINCATIQENLAESEFFGYEDGAFTGAHTGGKYGYFELANNGILFLDEISALSMNMQSKLLRVLQEKQFYRVGGTRPVNVDVRVICASNIPLRKLVQQGEFREDLYYRLNICEIVVPPLRERKEDIYALTRLFLERYNKQYKIEKSMANDAILRLYDYDWPGNVRELENMIHRLVINVKGNVIDKNDVAEILDKKQYDDLVLGMRETLERMPRVDFRQIIDDQEKRLLAYALEKKGSTRKAAEYLGITQAHVMRLKRKFEI